jgi:Tol biopolymer transport system component
MTKPQFAPLPAGRCYFAITGARPVHRGIWSYRVAKKEIKQITRVQSISQSVTRPKVSPDGKRVAFTRPQQVPKLFIVERRQT